jgi:hypothetical protein
MKMVKSLLLGSAAGLVAVAGAQAADLPVKAKPVQYVKICSLYGAGFYYMPGTDLCIKIGGWVRQEVAWGTNGSSTGAVSLGDLNNRYTNNLWERTRGYITADAREQTAFGVARAYIAVGLSGNHAVAFDSNRAFIQWAGFTFGLSQSFYDFYSSAAVGYFGWGQNSEDTGDAGQPLVAYTAQFGNGWSATISGEARRSTQIVLVGGGNGIAATAGTTSIGAFSASGAPAFASAGYGGWQVPDIVGNLRVDQAWGSAQVMGALHEVNASYYNPGAPGAFTNENSGNPGDKWGWVVGGGIKLNAPMIGPGDYFQAEVNYTQGALRYLTTSNGIGNFGIAHNSTAAFGILSDGVGGSVVGAAPAAAATGLDLTTGWGFNASYEHFWNTQWRTSIYTSYMNVKYNSEANAQLCRVEGQAPGAGGIFAVATAGCDNNWNMWTVGSRTQWNVTKDFYMGLDVAYGRLQSAQLAGVALPLNVAPTGVPTTSSITSIGDQDIWGARFRVHKDFYP